MENFFYDDIFLTDIEDLLSELEIDEEIINELPDDWEIECFESVLEPAFVLDKKIVVEHLLELSDNWEDRFPEDSERAYEDINLALNKGIDIDKINSLLPKLYYPNGKKFKITKRDLMDNI